MLPFMFPRILRAVPEAAPFAAAVRAAAMHIFPRPHCAATSVSGCPAIPLRCSFQRVAAWKGSSRGAALESLVDTADPSTDRTGRGAPRGRGACWPDQGGSPVAPTRNFPEVTPPNAPCRMACVNQSLPAPARRADLDKVPPRQAIPGVWTRVVHPAIKDAVPQTSVTSHDGMPRGEESVRNSTSGKSDWRRF